MKISAYTEQKTPLPADFIVIAYGGVNYKIKLQNMLASIILNRKSAGYTRDEFFSNYGTHYPFGWTLQGGGGITYLASVANHQGIYRLGSDPTQNTPTSYAHGIATGCFFLAGGENTEMIFRMQSLTNEVINFGFNDFIGTFVTDGIYINIAGSTLSGKSANGGRISTTLTNYILSNNTWYRVKILLSSDSKIAYYYLYDSSTNTLLWSDTLSTNIPTTGLLTHKLTWWKTTAGAVDLFDVDYMAFNAPMELTR